MRVHAEYSEPDPYDATRAPPVAEKASPMAQFLGVQEGRSSIQQRIDMKKRGVGRQKYPFLGAFINLNYQATSK